MASFRYEGRGQGGKVVAGRMSAGSSEAVAGELAGMGVTPVRIVLIDEDSDPLEGLRRWWRMRRITAPDLLMFCRQMYTLSRAGVPIIRILRGLAETSRRPELGEVLDDVASKLESGHELAGAMQQHPLVFSNLFVSIIHVGEAAGRLEEAFRQLYEYLELEEETRKRIKSATRYPILVLVAITIAVGIINVFVIPPFAKLFAGFGADLPWATKLLIATSQFSVNYWPHVLAGAVAGWFGLRHYLQSEDGGLRWDRFKLRLPVIGSILERALLARFCRTLAMTLQAGLPITQSLAVAARAADTRPVAQPIPALLSEIQHGHTPPNAAHADPSR